MRCLTIAHALRDHGGTVEFVSRTFNGNICSLIEENGYNVHRLPMHETVSASDQSSNTAWHGDYWLVDMKETIGAFTAQHEWDWLIVDNYALDERWEVAMRKYARRIMMIDDLANRPHDCDLLLDQIYAQDQNRYQGLLPGRCRKLMGSKYVLLRPEFTAARARAEFPGKFSNNNLVHVFFGTSDAPGYTIRFSRLLLDHFPELRLKIAVGGSFMHMKQLVDLAERYSERANYKRGVTDMAEHMWGCSVAVGTPGMSTWERACMGLPAAHVTNSDNQVEILRSLKDNGFCEWLGYAETITDDTFVAGMSDFLNDLGRLTRMRQAGLASVDGKGVKRVLREMSTVQ